MPRGIFTTGVSDLWAAVRGRVGTAVDSGAGASSQGIQRFAEMASSASRTLDTTDQLSPIGLGWSGGQLVSFEFKDVLSAPIRDHRGRMIGVALPRDVEHLARIRRWAREPDRRSDKQYIDGRSAQDSGISAGLPLSARWAGIVRATRIPPKYVNFHASAELAEIQVAVGGTVHQVATPGKVLGHYLAYNPFYRVISEANPKGPTILTGCDVASPAASTGRDAVAELEAHNAVSGPVYGAKGDVVLGTKEGSHSFIEVRGLPGDDIYDEPFERLR